MRRYARAPFPAVHPFVAVLLAIWLAVSVVLLAGSTPVQAGDAAIHRTWARTDKPVAAGRVTRTWIWGPALTAEMPEADTGSPTGTRTVQYFDKARMELPTDPDADPGSIWYVTNGLLARELITGLMQTGPGASDFEQRAPAMVNIGGDPDDSNGPTYASFAAHVNDAPAANGWLITQRIARDGTVSDDPGLGDYGVTAHERVTVPGLDHQVASVFWEFMNATGTVYDNGSYRDALLYPNPYYATGYPITEPYWTSVRVGGTERTVLVQVFERRVLTYTPANDPEWRVEAGNVGRHYYEWRYGAVPSEPGPAMFDFMDDLEDDLASLVNGWEAWNAVSVMDLQTGRIVSVNGDRQQPAACTNKIFIMIAIAQDIEAGKYTEADVESLVLSAMGPSNTLPAYELIRIAGGGDYVAGLHRINGIMQQMGMTRSVLRHAPDYPDVDNGFGTGDNYLTANEMSIALAKLWNGELLTGWARDYVLWSMTIAIPGQQYSLGGGIPDEATLYHKIGLIYAPYNTWNDAGIVTFERNGQTYVYAISYLGSYSGSWLDAYYHGADASAVAWNAFNWAYR
jgi:hypothetical protein